MYFERKYNICFAIIIVIIHGCTDTFGQKKNCIKIKLVDNKENFGISFAKISVIRLSNKQKLSSLTDSLGISNFCFNDSLPGKLKIISSALSYEGLDTVVLNLTSTTQYFEFKLTRKEIQLADVTVIQRQIVKDAGKLIYSVKQDRFSSAIAAPELFSKLPGVTYSSGVLKLNGRSGVLLLIDGKGELNTQEQQLAMLSSLSADQIAKIEIISIPLARYSANINSVINIITKKEKGYSNFHISYMQPLFMDGKNFGGQFPSGSSSTNLNFKIGKIKTSFLFGITNSRTIENIKGNTTLGSTLKYEYGNNATITNFRATPSVNLEYDINKRSSINLNADLYFNPSFLSSTNELYTFYTSSEKNPDSTQSAINHFNRSRSSIEVTGNYKYLLDSNKQSNFYLNFIYSGNPSSDNNLLINESSNNNLTILKNKYHSAAPIYNASAIVSNLIKSKIADSEFGIQFNALKNDTRQFLNEAKSNFHYQEQISSAFFTAKWKFNNYLLITELRGEQLSSKAIFTGNDSTQFAKTEYFKLYPNLLLQKTLNDHLSLSIGYTKRVRRPFPNDINPSGSIINSYSFRDGNINFKPSYTDRIEAQLLFKSFIATLYYEKNKGKRILITDVNDPAILTTSNAPGANKWGISLTHSVKIGKVFTSDINVNYFYSEYTGNVPYYNSSTNLFEISASSNLILGKNTQIEAFIYYNAKLKLEYIINKGFVSSSIKLRQILLKDKLTLNLSISDPLGVEKSRYGIYYSNRFGYVNTTSNNRILSLGVVYRFPLGIKLKNQTYKMKNTGEIRAPQ